MSIPISSERVCERQPWLHNIFVERRDLLKTSSEMAIAARHWLQHHVLADYVRNLQITDQFSTLPFLTKDLPLDLNALALQSPPLSQQMP